MAAETLPSDITDCVRRFVVSTDFSICEIDGRRSPQPAVVPCAQIPLAPNSAVDVNKPPIQRGLSDIPTLGVPLKLPTHPNDDPRLGPVLGKLVGTYQGAGMNTIFRPNNHFTNLNNDNLLEVNLTVETLQFMGSNVLGKVPNRGFFDQDDVFLTGIPYQQTVSDRLNPGSGKADLPNKKIDLHFEQGLLMRIPPTKNPNTLGRPTIARMGSIPHGTTINAQAFEPKDPITGAPNIKEKSIAPFSIGFDQKTHGVPEFDNLNKPKVDKMIRKPENLQPFLDNKTITFESLRNPNKFLEDVNKKKNIISHFEFTVRTRHPELPGGGTANINFLCDGEKKDKNNSFAIEQKPVNGMKPKAVPARGNATVAEVSCQYWVSTVQHNVVIPAGDYTLENTNDDPVFLANDDVPESVPVPRFQVQVRKKTCQANTIQVFSTQIQYSQNVTLDFGVLSWPHVSVATLVPALPILVPAADPALKNVK